MNVGVPYAFLSALLFGASTPFAKLFLGTVDPWMMAGLLYLGSGLGLMLVLLLRGVLRLPVIEAPLRRSDIPWLALVITIGGVLGPVFLMLGLTRTDAAGASLLLNLEGLATMGIAWVILGENVDRRLLVGAFSILVGAAVLSWQGHASFRWGALLITVACLCWGIDNNLTRNLSLSNPVQTAMFKGLVAGIVNLILASASGATLPKGGAMLAVGVVGFVGYGVSLVLFVLALRHLGAARTSAYFCFAPFAGALLAIVMLGDRMSVQLIAASSLMGFGLWLHLTERHGHEHIHEAITHEHLHTHDAHHEHEHADVAALAEPHNHQHRHQQLAHRHGHFPDIHHRHEH
jgi:drug/metabolite transporter (DMT)-like permease